MNTHGSLFRLTTFGESHGPYIGGVIDGVPPGIRIDTEKIQSYLSRRKGKLRISTTRVEEDIPEFISGMLDGYSTGTPLAFLVPNQEKNSRDYSELKDLYRPSHADYTYEAKYGIRDHRGGGRASARETVARVIAGAVAMQVLEDKGMDILAYTSSVGRVVLSPRYPEILDREAILSSIMGCPDQEKDTQMHQEALLALEEGDTIGGRVSCRITGVRAGLGSPLYGKMESRLAAAMMSIGAAVAFEMGDGTKLSSLRGSMANDPFSTDSSQKIVTTSNRCGGVQGGITNGMPILFSVSFKPIPSLPRLQETVNTSGERCSVHIRGRHDASVIPRVLPVVESMAAMVVLDEWLRWHAYAHE